MEWGRELKKFRPLEKKSWYDVECYINMRFCPFFVRVIPAPPTKRKITIYS
jgi:hypothetical protein